MKNYPNPSIYQIYKYVVDFCHVGHLLELSLYNVLDEFPGNMIFIRYVYNVFLFLQINQFYFDIIDFDQLKPFSNIDHDRITIDKYPSEHL